MATEITTSKIRIKIGRVEVEYEGAHSYLADGLPSLLDDVLELSKRIPEENESIGSSNHEKTARNANVPAVGTVSSIAAKLQSKSGPDLVIAAAAKLTFVDGNESFTRQSLLDAMKSASAYYKGSYRGNLSTALNGLQKEGRLTEVATNQFAVTAGEREKLQMQLA